MDASPGPPASTGSPEPRRKSLSQDPAKQGTRRRRGTSARSRRAPAGAARDATAAAQAGSGSPEALPAFEPGQDWRGIEIGATVDVHLPGGYSYPGSVDAMTADCGVVWIRSDGGTRRMFGHFEGVRLAPRAAVP